MFMLLLHSLPGSEQAIATAMPEGIVVWEKVCGELGGCNLHVSIGSTEGRQTQAGTGRAGTSSKSVWPHIVQAGML
jgi:hypothetical protein